MKDIRDSIVIYECPWLLDKRKAGNAKEGWTVSIKDVIRNGTLALDPKRYCKKFVSLQDVIRSTEHITLGDILEPIRESVNRDGEGVTKRGSDVFHYIEIYDIDRGEFNSTELRGWQLPTHFAEKGDLFIGAIWGSVEKWFMITIDSKLKTERKTT